MHELRWDAATTARVTVFPDWLVKRSRSKHGHIKIRDLIVRRVESATVTDVFPVSFGVAVELPLDPQPLVMPIVSRREKKEKMKTDATKTSGERSRTHGILLQN